MANQSGPLSDRPKVVVACMCADFQVIEGGGFNIIRIYDSLDIQRPSGIPPEMAVPIAVHAVTCWTEGLGQHVHQLRVLDEDANQVYLAPPVTISLADFGARHWILDRVLLLITKATRYAIEISLNGDPESGLKYIFPITLG